jgi:hypothetical protein
MQAADFIAIGTSESPPIVVERLLALVAPQKAVIDVGSGVHGPVGQHAFEKLPDHVALHCGDIFTVREMPPRWTVHCPLDMRDMFGLRDSWDWIQTFDTLEHIPKDDALVWLDKAKRVARAVLVYVPTSALPDGFMDNSQGEATYPDNPYQKHLSGWVVDDFTAAGYWVCHNGRSLFAFHCAE